MKKKGARNIPDFAPHHTAAAAPTKVVPGGHPVPPAPTRAQQTVKPQSTSAKSGRRGQ